MTFERALVLLPAVPGHPDQVIHWDSVLLWGFFATLLLTTSITAAQWMHVTRMSIPYMLGTLWTSHFRWAQVLGYLTHLVNGWGFAFLYGFAFEALGRSGWWLGAVFGLLHGIIMLALLIPILPYIHPRMATHRHGPVSGPLLEPPGFLALNYGTNTPLVTLAAHLVYGAILGAFYGFSLVT